MTLNMDPELAGALHDLVGDDPPRPPAPGDWRAIRAGVAAMYPALTAQLPRYAVGRDTFTATSPDGAPVRLHWFTPAGTAGARPGPVVLHAHGGGMIAGTVAMFAPYVAEYVARSGVPFLSVDYRLAPEAPGPLPAEDVFTGLAWLVEHAGSLGVDPARIAVMGESAGGGLAAACAIRARGARVSLARQILIYPMLDDRTVDPDPQLEAVASWPYSNNRTAWDALLGTDRGSSDVPPTVAPARLTDYRGLPPAYVEVGELDIFRDEAVAYARGLWTGGISAELHVLPGLVHGWDQFAPHSTGRAAALARRLQVLRTL